MGIQRLFMGCLIIALLTIGSAGATTYTPWQVVAGGGGQQAHGSSVYLSGTVGQTGVGEAPRTATMMHHPGFWVPGEPGSGIYSRPDPSSDLKLQAWFDNKQLLIHYSMPKPDGRLRLFDLEGRCLLTIFLAKTNGMLHPPSDLFTQQVYILRLDCDGKQQTRRVVHFLR